MQQDFHYYGTYVAACLAGYPFSEAQTIAHAAQYVDDSVSFVTINRILEKGAYGIDFQPIPTSQGSFEMFLKNLSIKTPQSELRSVWAPFHFLPGNYESQIQPDPNASLRMKEYTGTKRQLNRLWKYNDRAKWQFKLLSLPQSPLITMMINDIISKHKGKPYELQLAGLRMHVLADTGAHMYYAGTPAWHVNNANTDEVFDMTVEPPEKIKYKDIGVFGEGETHTPHDPVGSESFAYVGHGRMGHVPDYPWIKYKYTPEWSSEPIVKDNPREYLRTFKEMVTALKCIREKREYDVLHVDPIDGKYTDAIDKILIQKHEFGSPDIALQQRCKTWTDAISNGSLGSIDMPEKYDPDVWLNTAKQHKPIEETDYYKFNWSAKEHLKFVKLYLEEDGIPLDDFE